MGGRPFKKLYPTAKWEAELLEKNLSLWDGAFLDALADHTQRSHTITVSCPRHLPLQHTESWVKKLHGYNPLADCSDEGFLLMVRKKFEKAHRNGGGMVKTSA